ncbi:hypothetical protein [Pelagibius sp.]|uniref:hypothetical protein n=1 Tax=Pelagibius sp. TaxID=1931238 RepID=UPI003BAF0792
MDKPGVKNRAMFISPYLRRPIRPLNKVLVEREQETVNLAQSEPANDTPHSTVAGGGFVDPADWVASVRRALSAK